MNKLINQPIALAICFVLCIRLNAQELPQVFTPNASELGKYGQVPVNYFNGLPEISIPLINFQAKGYELPIYLSYYASGNKPDSHPGWTGLGWNLHAGGLINRVIKGSQKDEMSKEELEYIDGLKFRNIGYLYYADGIQKKNWSSYEELSRLLPLILRKFLILVQMNFRLISMDYMLLFLLYPRIVYK